MTDGTVAFNARPARPPWGLWLVARKSRSTGTPIRIAPLPPRVVIDLEHGTQAAPVLRVAVGDHVQTGQPLTSPADAADPCIHASISGRVSAIAPCTVAGHAGPRLCATIDGDGQDSCWTHPEAGEDPATLPAATLRRLIGEGGIVGLGGAGYSTARKLAAGTPALLLVNGAECEPYISCDDMLLRERAARVVAGSRLLLAASGAQQGVIAVKSDMDAARVALWQAIDAAADPRLAITVVTAKYPVGGERQLIQLVTGREVPAGGLPADIGCLCQNVATVAAVADWLIDRRPLISRIVTVTGGGISTPCNVEARIGTPAAALVALAGGYRNDPQRLVMGGPMMGVALPDDELPITPTTNCLLALTAAEIGTPVEPLPCIRCGACVEACPAALLPHELFGAARHADGNALHALHLGACIECGACDQVCPSHLPLTRRFIDAKILVARHDAAAARAAEARRRHTQRSRRLEAEAEAQARELDARLPAHDTLAALLDRAARSDGEN